MTAAACLDPETEESYATSDDIEEPELRAYSPPNYPDAKLQDDIGSLATGPSPYFKRGVVATTESLAATEGLKIIDKGGDAIDAAVVVQAVLNVVEPQSSGIGGGGLWLIYLADTDQTWVIDCRERAPGKATTTMLASQSSGELKETSGITVGVPGTLHCMKAALDLLPGGLTLELALQPAIDAASGGIYVSERLADDSDSSRLDNEYGNPLYDEARKVFRPGGQPLVAGKPLQQPKLASALTLIAKRGLNAFYDCGDSAGIASALIDTQKARRSSYSGGYGRMECSDLKAYAPVKTPPIKRNYHGYTVVTSPAPSSGIFLLQMLGMLERFDLGKSGYGFGQYYSMNVMQEAMRLAFADRAMWLGDPLKVYVPTTGLLSKQYVDQRSSKITAGKRLATVTAGDPRPYDSGSGQKEPGKLAHKESVDVDLPGTTHFVTADGKGNVVSVSSTISNTWGTGLMVTGFGFMLNNQLINFNDIPQYDNSPYNPGANDVAPFKRPRTTMAPTMVFLGGKPIAAFGSPGSTTIINAILEFFVDLADFRMTLQQSVAAPRFSLDSPSKSAATDIESGFSSSVRTSLSKLGYKFDGASAIGAVQAVLINPKDSRKYATADPRRIGAVAGLGE